MTVVLAVAAALAGAPAADHPSPAVVPVVSANQSALSIRQRSVKKFGRKKVIYYAHLHRKWSKRAGRSVVGRQIVKFGMPKRGGGHRVATRAEWRHTLAVFNRWEHPPAPVAPAPTLQQTNSAASSAYSYGGGSYSIPTSIVMCESGGNYGAVNPSSGAYGAYQILPSTSAAYGCDMATPAGQDDCAARIWAGGAGRGQWAC